jgi:MFS family permease
LRILPLMGGMLGASVISGRLVTRWGRYRVFPIVGTALMTLGAYLMSLIGQATGGWVMAGYMFVFGAGLGLIMQVLVVAVQNAVSYRDLGVATSSATFFRMIGGSFGTAVFGAIYANVLRNKLAPTLASIHGAQAHLNLQTQDPSVLQTLHRLAPEIYEKVLAAITGSVQTVFLVAVPIAFLAFLLSWLLPELELRKTVQTVDAGEAFGIPDPRTSLQEIQLALERLSIRENRRELYQTLAHRAGIALPPQSCWLLYRLADCPASTVGEVARRLNVDSQIIVPGIAGLIGAGMITEVTRGDECDLVVTPAGKTAITQLTEARRNGLTELLEGWNPQEHPELIDMVKHLATSLLADDERLVADALPGTSLATAGSGGTERKL